MDINRPQEGDWETVQPLGKRELDRLFAGHFSRRERSRLYRILNQCGLCIFEK